jgi:hypothetical protein
MSALYVFSPSEAKYIINYIGSEQESISVPFNLQAYPATTESTILAIRKLKLGMASFECNATNMPEVAWDNKYVAYVDNSGMLIVEDATGISVSLDPKKQYFFILAGGLSNKMDTPPQIDYVITGTFGNTAS